MSAHAPEPGGASQPGGGETGRAFDVIVIGAGPGGEVLSGLLGQAGLQVALIESELVGGECSFWACMPSKALLRPAELVREATRVPGAAQAVGGRVDARTVLRRRDEVIHELDDSGQLPWLEKHHVELFRSHGRLDGERRVRAGKQLLFAREAVVLAGGTRASLPPIPGLADARPWTNREATTAGAVPARLAILGGGPVGSELAQAWSSLGSRVELVEGANRLLAKEEPFAGELVARAPSDDGVRVHLGIKAASVRRTGDELAVALESGQTLDADALLVAVGRTPRTDGLGLETVGVDAEGPVEVDEAMRVPGHSWLYAIGDINGRALLTHMAKYQARLVAATIRGQDPGGLRLDAERSPRVTFTDPQVAAVGLNRRGRPRARPGRPPGRPGNPGDGGGQLPWARGRGPDALCHRRRAQPAGGGHVRRPGRRRVAAGRHDRGGGRNPTGHACSRRAGVSYPQRAVARADRRLGWSARAALSRHGPNPRSNR